MTEETKTPAGADIQLPAEISAPEEKLKRFWPKLKRVLGRVPFAGDLIAAWFCWADPKTPARTKGIIAAALAYFVVPADMVPDVVIGLGFTDDAAVLTMALGLIGSHIRPRHREAARNWLGQRPGEPETLH